MLRNFDNCRLGVWSSSWWTVDDEKHPHRSATASESLAFEASATSESFASCYNCRRISCQLTNGGRKRKKGIHNGKRIHWVEMHELLYWCPCIDYIPTKITKLSGTRAKLNQQGHVLAGDGQRKWDMMIGWASEILRQLTKFTYSLDTDEEDGMG